MIVMFVMISYKSPQRPHLWMVDHSWHQSKASKSWLFKIFVPSGWVGWWAKNVKLTDMGNPWLLSKKERGAPFQNKSAVKFKRLWNHRENELYYNLSSATLCVGKWIWLLYLKKLWWSIDESRRTVTLT